MPLEPYTATICGRERLVLGWNAAVNLLLLADGDRYTFEPLTPPDFLKPARLRIHPRKLLAVCTLEYIEGNWLIDGMNLAEWVSAQQRLAEDERNQRRTARGLSPIGFITTHPDLSLEDWFANKPAPDPNADERRLDEHPNLFRWWVLNTKLREDEFGLKSKGQSDEVHGVAWFEGHDDEPLLLASFLQVAGEDAAGATVQNPQQQPQPEKEPKDVASNRKRERLPESQFRSVKLRSGKHIGLPEGAREVVVSLDALGGRDIPCVALKEEIARMRGVKELPESYSPAKVLKGSMAGCKLIDDRIVTFHRKHHQKLTLYTLRLLKSK